MDWEELDDVHTPENPYCDDPNCWCHVSVEYHDLAIQPYSDDDDINQAYAFYGLVRS